MDEGGGMPPGGGGDDGYPEDEEPEEDAAEFHGEKPVKMNSTGYPGLGNVNIPDFNMVPKTKPGFNETGMMSPSHYAAYSRRREGTSGGPSKSMTKNPDLMRLSRDNAALKKQLNDFRLKYAMSEAQGIVNGLVQEGIIFGDTPEAHQQGVQETTEYLAHLGLQSESDRDYEVQVIRTRYKRKPTNPAAPVYPGAARYARSTVSNGVEEDPEEYEPRNPQEASDLADLIVLKKMSRKDAVNPVRKRNYSPFDVSNPNS